ncbi:MAG: efflux RND transporter periplasmic adaptor subunit [Methylocystis sp.]
MNFLQNRRLQLLALAIALALAAAWRWLPASHTSATDAPQTAPPIPVTAATARAEDVPITVDAVGTVQALNTATIRAQVDGRLVRLPFNEGEDVKKGDVVALIEPNLYQAQYDQAVAKKAQDEATLANARLDLVRYKRLTVGHYGSQQQYDTQKYLVAQLEAQVRADQAAIDSAKTTLEYCTIPSPIDGRAGIRLVDVGNILHATDQTGILIITQLRPIYVIFTIPQQALPSVQAAQEKGVARVNALRPDNATLIETGTVSVIDNQIDQTTGTAKIKATFANPSLKLWPGQFVNMRLTVDTLKQATVVPSTAIQQRGQGRAYVYVLDANNVATLRDVTTGYQDDNINIAVVKQGLAAGENVVTSGFARLSNGAKARVVKAPDQDALKTAPPSAVPGAVDPAFAAGGPRPPAAARPSNASSDGARTK